MYKKLKRDFKKFQDLLITILLRYEFLAFNYESTVSYNFFCGMIFMAKFCGINEKILCRKICLYSNSFGHQLRTQKFKSKHFVVVILNQVAKMCTYRKEELYKYFRL